MVNSTGTLFVAVHNFLQAIIKTLPASLSTRGNSRTESTGPPSAAERLALGEAPGRSLGGDGTETFKSEDSATTPPMYVGAEVFLGIGSGPSEKELIAVLRDALSPENAEEGTPAGLTSAWGIPWPQSSSMKYLAVRSNGGRARGFSGLGELPPTHPLGGIGNPLQGGRI